MSIERPEIDGEASDSDGVSATTNEASGGADGNRGARVDGSGADDSTAETAISDEEGRALAFTVARALPRIVSRNAEGVQVFDAPMLAQCLREAGYRRETDVLREAAEGLRKRERRLGERGISSQFTSGINYAALALSVRANELDRATEQDRG